MSFLVAIILGGIGLGVFMLGIKDFDLKGTYIGTCIIKDKTTNIIIAKVCDGSRKQISDEIYNYSKTLDNNNIITLEKKKKKNYGTVTTDYIQTRINRFTEQTKSDKYIIK